MNEAFKNHWPEYLIEAACLGIFMISACTFAALLGHPDSPIQMKLMGGIPQRMVMGLAMALTLIAIVYSPWGKRSGAHMNPSLTFTFWRLGKIEPWDAFFYIAFQFLGGIAGVLIARAALGRWIAHPSVQFAATRPGPLGVGVAFAAEVAISFILMTTVLTITNIDALNRFTGIFAAVLVATYITFESPISGMSMNPARTVGSAFSAHIWTALWIYFTAPLLGMLLAAEAYVRIRGTRAVICAKFHHMNDQRCIFRCGYAARKLHSTL